MKCVIGEGLAVSRPLQRGVTLLLSRLPGEESSAVQHRCGSHITRECGRVPVRFKHGGFGALGLCVKTQHCYLCSLQELQTIEPFMCTARYGLLQQNAFL